MGRVRRPFCGGDWRTSFLNRVRIDDSTDTEEGNTVSFQSSRLKRAPGSVALGAYFAAMFGGVHSHPPIQFGC